MNDDGDYTELDEIMHWVTIVMLFFDDDCLPRWRG